jgi:hypothetical protein
MAVYHSYEEAKRALTKLSVPRTRRSRRHQRTLDLGPHDEPLRNEPLPNERPRAAHVEGRRYPTASPEMRRRSG